MRGRTFSREFKLEVVRQIVSGQKRPAQVCREHQLAETVLLRWRREYEERGEAAFTPKEVASSQSSAEVRVAELERFCGQLAVENAALKKALQHLQTRQAAASKSGTP
jgi:transposase